MVACVVIVLSIISVVKILKDKDERIASMGTTAYWIDFASYIALVVGCTVLIGIVAVESVVGTIVILVIMVAILVYKIYFKASVEKKYDIHYDLLTTDLAFWTYVGMMILLVIYCTLLCIVEFVM